MLTRSIVIICKCVLHLIDWLLRNSVMQHKVFNEHSGWINILMLMYCIHSIIIVIYARNRKYFKIRYESRKKSTTEPSYSMVELRVDYRKNL